MTELQQQLARVTPESLAAALAARGWTFRETVAGRARLYERLRRGEVWTVAAPASAALGDYADATFSALAVAAEADGEAVERLLAEATVEPAAAARPRHYTISIGGWRAALSVGPEPRAPQPRSDADMVE